MILLDANILIYAHHAEMPEHPRMRDWLEELFAERDPVGLSWLTIWAFIRISSNPRLWQRPRPPHEHFDRLDEWLTLPQMVMVHPGPRHKYILRELIVSTNAVGTLASDAALAAIAIEHAATLASTDRDFRRFSGLRWLNPLE